MCKVTGPAPLCTMACKDKLAAEGLTIVSGEDGSGRVRNGKGSGGFVYIGW